MRDPVVVVLIVEDDWNVSSLYRQVVSRMGMIPIVAQDVYSALNSQAASDILLLDLALPNGAAQIVLEKWSEESVPCRPIAVISGFVHDSETRDELYASGVWNIFEKPADLETLETVLGNFLAYTRYKRGAECARESERESSRIIKKLWCLVAVLGVLIFAVAAYGPNILPWLLELFIKGGFVP